MITRQPTNQMINALQDVTFACEAKGFQVKYEWKRHSGSVTGGRQSSITISKATPLDEDQYYCVAMTEGGYAFSDNITLKVNGENASYFIDFMHFVPCIIFLLFTQCTHVLFP